MNPQLLFLALITLVTTVEASLPLDFTGESPRNPLLLKSVHGIDQPFVPEDFHVVRRRVVFDKNEFDPLSFFKPQSEKDALSAAILTVLIENQAAPTNKTSKVYNNISTVYIGKAKLGGRPGNSARFAATVNVQICDRNLTLCHFEECDLDLDQKDETDPNDYKPVFTLHSKECSRVDSWCYFCQNDEEQAWQTSGSCESQQIKKNCNAQMGDLSVKEKWACRTTYTIVAGQSDAISKDCIAVPSGEEVPELVKCVGLDDSDYEVQCVCHQGSGCNKAADNARDIFKPTNSNEDEARIVNELNKSIRQLRADLKRTLERYTAKYNTPQAPPPPTTSQTVD